MQQGLIVADRDACTAKGVLLSTRWHNQVYWDQVTALQPPSLVDSSLQ
jgi:hypothetical protein